MKDVELIWKLTLPTADIDAAWRIISDSDRFNRAAGLGLRFTEHPMPNGTVQRRGVASRLGLTVRWIEQPFEYVAPHWFQGTRTFTSGPMAQARVRATLTEGESGVELVYRILLTPRSWLLRPLVVIDAATSLKPALERALNAAISQLGDAPLPYDALPELPATVLNKLSLNDLTSGAQLVELLRHGARRELDRMRPLALAERWKIDEDTVIGDMITASRRGVLEVRWDLLCPSCLGPKTRLTKLELTPETQHCSSCNIDYDGSFADSVEVTFRPAAWVREVLVPVDCVLSPQRTPHVLAQEKLLPADEIGFIGGLSVGAYRIDTRPASGGGASIEVRKGHRANALAIDVTKDGITPSVLRVGPGMVEIVVRSCVDVPVYVRVERRWRPEFTLTAGRLMEREGVAELLPEGALPPGVTLRTQRRAVLAIDGRSAPKPELLSDLLRSPKSPRNITFDLDDQVERPVELPQLVHEADQAVLAYYDSVQGALNAARMMLVEHHVGVALDVGLTSTMQQGDRIIPVGAVVDRAIHTARALGAKRLGAHDDVLHDTEASAVLKDSGLPVFRQEGQPIVWFGVPPNEPAPDELSVPETVGGRYRLHEEIGRGGMGIVHAATDDTTGAQVVVKTLLPTIAKDPAHAQRFYWEARIASRLSHPHLVEVHNYGTDDQLLWLVMERLHGEELHDRLTSDRALNYRQAVQIGIAMLDGLHAAHDRGIVHRDIKPANIFLCIDPAVDHPKVLDFGIAISMDDELEQDQQTVLGTPRYLSPEQVECERLDGRSDVYSAGLVMYEMLSGDIPFDAPNLTALVMMRLAIAPAPLQERNPGLPTRLCDIVMRALEVDPDERWGSASEMAEALRRLEL